MDSPRPHKVAVVEEVRERFSSSGGAVFTEYRGLSVRDLADLRNSMREAGGEYRVFKNTLVRRAAHELDLDIADILVGPVAIAFVGTRPDGSPGDPVLVAKALQAFAKANPNLVIKGGLLDDRLLDAGDVTALASVAPREELLARFAGGLAAPMRNMASLLQALPQKFAYGLQALIEAGGAEGAPAPADAAATTETTDDDTDAAPAAEDDTAAEDSAADDTASADDEAPADAAADEE